MLSPKAIAFGVEELLKKTVGSTKNTEVINDGSGGGDGSSEQCSERLNGNNNERRSNSETVSENNINIVCIKSEISRQNSCEWQQTEAVDQYLRNSTISEDRNLQLALPKAKKSLKRPLEKDFPENSKEPRFSNDCQLFTPHFKHLKLSGFSVNAYDIPGRSKSFINPTPQKRLHYNSHKISVNQQEPTIWKEIPTQDSKWRSPKDRITNPYFQPRTTKALQNIMKSEKNCQDSKSLEHQNEMFEESYRTLVQNGVSVTLLQHSLWSEFHKHQTEMIITKNGRRMFPVIKIRVRGLDPDSLYMIYLDIKPLDGKRYRYGYQSSTWIVAGTGDMGSQHQTYIHPDSPAAGSRWMEMLTISFDKLKLTNNKSKDPKGQVFLHSMQKYLPRIWIQRLGNAEEPNLITSASPDSNLRSLLGKTEQLSFSFPETTFITVTAYQNQKITKLKINSNPFAKGFRDNAKYKEGNDRGLMTTTFRRLNGQNLPRFSFNNLTQLPPPAPEPYIVPCFPFSQILPLNPTHLSPAGYQSKWPPFAVPVKPSTSHIIEQQYHLLPTRSSFELEKSSLAIDLTKNRHTQR